MPLLIFFAAIVLLLVVVVVDAGTAYLRRQELDALADGAALRGADLAAQGADAYRHGIGGEDLDLSVAAARRAVRDYLTEVGALRDHPGLSVQVRVADDEVVVDLSAPVDLPLTMPGAPVRPVVRASAAAVVRPES
ncbi:pilus assembly protein TadG-related protein [Nocardioides sambongensis]|uniref:pilus assembly protein TadG-related protein n=1 Tax=Nocardioides sambongensis TaxID=2589074 RepID=UPI00112631C7|nr:pilus assembly protein TadG-related protein [Nocardioides sambongensis]